MIITLPVTGISTDKGLDIWVDTSSWACRWQEDRGPNPMTDPDQYEMNLDSKEDTQV